MKLYKLPKFIWAHQAIRDVTKQSLLEERYKETPNSSHNFLQLVGE